MTRSASSSTWMYPQLRMASSSRPPELCPKLLLLQGGTEHVLQPQGQRL